MKRKSGSSRAGRIDISKALVCCLALSIPRSGAWVFNTQGETTFKPLTFYSKWAGPVLGYCLVLLLFFKRINNYIRHFFFLCDV